MKLIVKKVCLFFVVIFFISSCKTKENKCNHEIEKINCYPNNDKPSNVITYKEMAEMFTQYQGNQGALLDEYVTKKLKIKHGETESNWFPIADLKQYIAYVEKLSKEKEIELTGIRIFSAAYPKNHSDELKRSRQTIILAPTTIIGNKDNVAFEPLKSSIGKPMPMLTYLEKFKKVRTIKKASSLSNIIFQERDEFSSAANRSHLSPPN